MEYKKQPVRMNILRLLVPILLLLVYACNKSNQKDVNLRRTSGKEITGLNSYLVEKDRERIINYAERKNLAMKESKSGLWFMIRNAGSGGTLKDKDHILMDYKCSLLDGTLCYSSETIGPKDVVLGRSEIEAGLNEGLRMLGHGGEAVFILPPFLAYGLLGDNRSIPPRATLVYEIKIRDR
jgi:FKBP-type peptidyl-prolyl cis-trans isomerase FkpA